MSELEKLLNDPSYSEIAGLYNWSTNYDYGKSPFNLFIDMIGWSEDNLGCNTFSADSNYFGYIELSHIADALQAYVRHPQDARDYIEALLEAEVNE